MKKLLTFLTCALVLSVLLLATPAQATPLNQYGVIVSTPNPDGSIVHIVQEGDSLWSIAMAYGVSGAEIMTNSGNSAEASQVFIGQILVIRHAFTATPTSRTTPTPTAGTPSPTVFVPSRTPIPSKTPLPSPSPTATLSVAQQVFGNGQPVGLVLIGLSVLGLLLLLIFGFLRKDKPA